MSRIYRQRKQTSTTPPSASLDISMNCSECSRIDGNSSNSPTANASLQQPATNGVEAQSVAVPPENFSQQRKQYNYSGHRSCSVVSSGGLTLPPSSKGILKLHSRYDPQSSNSESCSPLGKQSLLSSSMEGGEESTLRSSQRFSDTPEENASVGRPGSSKKTVRFNDTVEKRVFSANSSILGQRKKNQKRRDCKQRALQRRLSASDTAQSLQK